MHMTAPGSDTNRWGREDCGARRPIKYTVLEQLLHPDRRQAAEVVEQAERPPELVQVAAAAGGQVRPTALAVPEPAPPGTQNLTHHPWLFLYELV